MTFPIFLFVLTFAVWWMMMQRFLRKHNYFFFCILLSFALQYILPVSYYVATGNYHSRFSSTTEEHFMQMQLLCILFMSSLAAGNALVKTPKINIAKAFNSPPRIELKSLTYILLTSSLIAIALQYKQFKYLLYADLLADRLIINRGTGYLQFLNVSSYFLTFVGIKRYIDGKMNFRLLLLYAIPAFVIYSMKLQRGHSLYPIFMAILAYLYTHFETKFINRCLVLGLFLLFIVGNVTSTIRKNIVANEKQTIQLIDDEDIIPTSYSHAELLSSMVADEQLNKLPSTIVGSLVNWVPRFFFVKKPITLGPVLNNHYSPDSGYYDLDNHRSSYTTDLLIEGYFNLGILGVFLFGFIFSLIASILWRSITAIRNQHWFFLAFPLALFILGFTGFFTDLGNWIGYIVVYYGVYFIIKFSSKFKSL